MNFAFNISFRQIKKQEIIVTHVTKPRDRTLEAFQNVEDAIADIKTQRNVMTSKSMIEDY